MALCSAGSKRRQESGHIWRLIVVSGPDFHKPGVKPSNSDPDNAGGSGGFLPSGRNVVFRLLAEEILEKDPKAIGLMVVEGTQNGATKRGAVRRVHPLSLDPAISLAEQISHAAGRKPDLLIIEVLDKQTITPALEVTRRGLRVISQLDSPFWGSGVISYLLEMGVGVELVSGLAWIVSVQRLPVLCPECRVEYTPSAAETQRLEQLLERHQPYGDQLPLPVAGREVYYREKGCSHCQFTGRRGDIAILDICQVVDGEARERLPFELCLPRPGRWRSQAGPAGRATRVAAAI